jgi:hypothetical protein
LHVAANERTRADRHARRPHVPDDPRPVFQLDRVIGDEVTLHRATDDDPLRAHARCDEPARFDRDVAIHPDVAVDPPVDLDVALARQLSADVRTSTDDRRNVGHFTRPCRRCP